MINYSSMTLGRLLDDVFVKVKEFRTPENLDEITIINLINSSIYEVMTNTYSFKDWAYNSRLDVANNTRLPVDYIKPIRVMLRNPDEDLVRYKEARFIDPKEFFAITDSGRAQKWNKSGLERPVYTIWGDTENIPYGFVPPNPSSLTVYISPDTMIGFIDCYMVPGKVSTPTDVIFIPAEFEELLLNTVVVKVLARSGMYDQASTLYQYGSELLKNIKANIEVKKYTEERSMVSFVEQVMPYANPEPLPEEQPNTVAQAAPQNGGPRGGD